MSPSPKEVGESAALREYTRGWDAMVRLVTQGRSWSGHERHVFYLNEGTGRFANASFASGLDHPDDGRALGLVDWDRDGDLDLWFRNRTTPRLRLMRNERGQDHPSVAIQLEGSSSNRDAIGAVVEILTRGGKPLVRSLRAGDLFLSQSSKVLHFGLGDHPEIRQVRVLWPGGSWESYAGLRAGQTVRLRQGSGRAERVEPPAGEESALTPGGLSGRPDRARARIILPARVPLFASFTYRDRALRPESLTDTSKGRLLVFWSSSCLRCQQELPALSRSREKLQTTGLDILALCVDPVEDPADAYALMDGISWPFAWGFVPSPVLQRLETLQHALFDREVPLAVPLALLLDGRNEVLALYRGSLEAEEVLRDASSLLEASDERRHHLAPPFAGRWFTHPVPPAFVAENLARRFEEMFPLEALPYFHLAWERAAGDRKRRLRVELGDKHQRLAQRHAEADRPEQAAAAFERALFYRPDSAAVHHNYAIFLARYGDLERARKLLERALSLNPSSEAAQEALQMVRQALAGAR